MNVVTMTVSSLPAGRPKPASHRRSRLAPSAAAPWQTACALAILLAAAAPAQLPAADIAAYGVAKGILFSQTNASAPAIRGGLPYAFQAVVQPPTNVIQSARVQWSVADLPLSAIATPNALGFVQRVASQDVLDATFPNGSYRIVTQTANDGAKTGNLSIAGNDYPTPPTVINYAAAQAIDPALPFTLFWNGFVGGTSSDFIFVQIENSQGRVFTTGAHAAAANALNGTATAAVIPGNTLQPGRSYVARIVFHKYSTLNAVDYPGALGTGGYFSQTDFTIATTGAGDTVAPAVSSTVPAHGATNVPVNAPIAIHFTETMSRGFALGISGTTAGRSFDWSPDSRTLLITPTSNWPPNATITWTLNPYYTQLAFGDTSSNPLPMETLLTFTTGTRSNSIVPATLLDPKRLPNGRFQFSVSGQTNATYVVQASQTFAQWSSLATNIAFTGSFDFLDTNAPSFPQRSYRVLSR